MKKKRAPHPTRIFKTPDELMKAWDEYKAHRNAEGKKWKKVQYVGKEGRRVEDIPVMPLILDGFEVFCRSNYGNVGQYFDNKDGYYDDFVAICSHIRQEIRDQQMTGGFLGYFNTSITQRLNNLSEKTEVKTAVEVPLFPKE